MLSAQEIWLPLAMHSWSCHLKLLIFDNDNRITAWKDKYLGHPVKWKGWTENDRLENPFTISQTKTTSSLNLTKGRLPMTLVLIEQLLELWQTKHKKNNNNISKRYEMKERVFLGLLSLEVLLDNVSVNFGHLAEMKRAEEFASNRASSLFFPYPICNKRTKAWITRLRW